MRIAPISINPFKFKTSFKNSQPIKPIELPEKPKPEKPESEEKKK